MTRTVLFLAYCDSNLSQCSFVFEPLLCNELAAATADLACGAGVIYLRISARPLKTRIIRPRRSTLARGQDYNMHRVQEVFGYNLCCGAQVDSNGRELDCNLKV